MCCRTPSPPQELQKHLFYRLVIVNAEIKVSTLPFFFFFVALFEVSSLYIGLYSLKSFQGCFSIFFFTFFFQPQNKQVLTRSGPGRMAGVGVWWGSRSLLLIQFGFLGQCCLLLLILGPAWSSVPGRTEICTSQLVPWRCWDLWCFWAQNRATCIQVPKPDTLNLASSSVLLISPPTFLGSKHFSLFFTFLVQALSPRTDQRVS